MLRRFNSLPSPLIVVSSHPPPASREGNTLKNGDFLCKCNLTKGQFLFSFEGFSYVCSLLKIISLKEHILGVVFCSPSTPTHHQLQKKAKKCSFFFFFLLRHIIILNKTGILFVGQKEKVDIDRQMKSS